MQYVNAHHTGSSWDALKQSSCAYFLRFALVLFLSTIFNIWSFRKISKLRSCTSHFIRTWAKWVCFNSHLRTMVEVRAHSRCAAVFVCWAPWWWSPTCIRLPRVSAPRRLETELFFFSFSFFKCKWYGLDAGKHQSRAFDLYWRQQSHSNQAPPHELCYVKTIQMHAKELQNKTNITKLKYGSWKLN